MTGQRGKTGGLFQVSLLDALMQGHFDGCVPLKELTARGDLGIGTFEGLNGELILLDGTVYRAAQDGSAAPAPQTDAAAFADVTFFDVSAPLHVSGPAENLAALRAALNRLISANANVPYAVRADGFFSSVRTRSVGRYQKPYPPLRAVTDEQTERVFKNMRGTLAGFYFPPFFKGINMTGWHLHFITSGRDAGGHLLDAKTPGLDLRLNVLARTELVLPQDAGFARLDFLRDMSQDVQKAEG